MLELSTLAKIPLFSGLDTDQLKVVRPFLKRHPVPRGQYIVKEDTYGDLLYILCAGTVKITKHLVKGMDDAEAREKVLATLTSDLLPTFGENGVLGDSVRTANVIAHTDCTMFTLSQTDYETLTRQNIQVAFVIMRNIACKLSNLLYNTDINVVKLATALYIAVQK